MRLHYLLHYRKPKPAATIPPRAVNLVKALEHMGQVLPRYSRSGIPHIDPVNTLSAYDGHINIARVRVLYGVVQQIYQHLPQLAAVTESDRRERRKAGPKLHSLHAAAVI